MTTTETLLAPSWPAKPIDPGVVWLDYDVRADEFLVYFGGRPVPAISDPLDAPGFEDTAIMLAVGPDDEATDEIVGIQVIPMLLGGVQDHPDWAILVWAAMCREDGRELLHERLPGFLDEVKHAVETYWTPAPEDEFASGE